MLRRHAPTRRRGPSWMASFISQIYRWYRTMWDHCNDIVHKHEAASTKLALLSDNDKKIIKEFTIGILSVRACDQCVISDTCVEKILSKKLKTNLIGSDTSRSFVSGQKVLRCRTWII